MTNRRPICEQVDKSGELGYTSLGLREGRLGDLNLPADFQRFDSS
jgi:hypothetical protein